MSFKRFGAVSLAMLLAAGPALADDGGGGGGRDIKIREEPQESPPAQSPPPEPAPPPESILDSIDDGWTCSAPKGAGSASGGTAPTSLRDFYGNTIGFFDANIERYRQLLADKATEIEGLDHKLAADFTADHADDKTHDDTIKSADAALQSVPNPKAGVTLAGPLTFADAGIADPELLRAVNAIRQVRAAAEMLKRLEAARALVKGEAAGCGVVID